MTAMLINRETGKLKPRIQIGNNESELTVLDWHENDKTLHGPNFSFTFDIKSIQIYKEGCHYLRIWQTGVSYNSNYYFCIFALYFFGTLIENEKLLIKKCIKRM